MFIKTFTILAVAGSALAAPVAQEQKVNEVEKRWQWNGGNWQGGWKQGGWGGSNTDSAPVTTTTEITTATAYVTAVAGETAPSSAPAAWTPPQQTWAPAPPAPAAPAATSEAPAPPAPAPAAPEEAPSSSSWSLPAAPSGTGYMATVDKWRSAFGLSALTQDSMLEANALKTATDSGGSLTHELNPGTMAQVLAPGNADNFDSVYVGGWLCEVPSAPALAGVCDAAGQGWAHNGETGHYDILTSTSYSKIGCSLADGIWACDLA